MGKISRKVLRLTSKACYSYLSPSAVRLRRDIIYGLKQVGLPTGLSPKTELTLRYGAFFNVSTHRFVRRDCHETLVSDVRAAISLFMGALCDDDYLDESDFPFSVITEIYGYLLAVITWRLDSIIDKIQTAFPIEKYSCEIKKANSALETWHAKFICEHYLGDDKAKTLFLQSLFFSDYLGKILERIIEYGDNNDSSIKHAITDFLNILSDAISGQVESFNQKDLSWRWRNYVDSSYRKSNQIFKAIFAIFSIISHNSSQWEEKYLRFHLQLYFDDFEDIETDTKNKIATLIYFPLEQSRIAETLLSNKDDPALYREIYQSGLLRSTIHGSFIFRNPYFTAGPFRDEDDRGDIQVEQMLSLSKIPLVRQCLVNSSTELNLPVTELARKRVGFKDRVLKYWGIDQEKVLEEFYRSGVLNNFRVSLDSNFCKENILGGAASADFVQRAILKRARNNINFAIKRKGNV